LCQLIDKTLIATYSPHNLIFKFDAGTSRGVLKEKKTWFLKIRNEWSEVFGIGECGPLSGLSIDDRSDFEEYLKKICSQLEGLELPATIEKCFDLANALIDPTFPSVRFALETALLDLINGGKREIFSNGFVRGQKSLAINGLVWMGSKDFMLEQIDRKIGEGYNCIKMKIGAIDFVKECELIEYIRSNFGEENLTIRVDANGAFTFEEAIEKLQILSTFKIHSIEQPIKPNHRKEMIELVKLNYLPIALDEELIGIYSYEDKMDLLDKLRPPYIILKPTLVGGIQSCQDWIKLAEERKIQWWITSALESNIGLNSIAQFAAEYDNSIPQGLGTGQLYQNNIASPLEIRRGYLHYNPDKVFEDIPF
jgi:o-succinylbenzoate synthase